MKYPIGIQDFEDLRRNGYKYVDKTNFVYKLADEGKYYFLSRPPDSVRASSYLH